MVTFMIVLNAFHQAETLNSSLDLSIFSISIDSKVKPAIKH